MSFENRYTVATESELDELLSGREKGTSILWSRDLVRQPVVPGSTAVVWRRGAGSGDPVRPFVLVPHEDEVRRLCGRYAQLRSDLSPLTSWCYLLTPRLFDSLSSLTVDPDLGGMEAAWSGLVVAEAMLMAGRAVQAVKLSACLATQSFAIARAAALWGSVSEDDVLQRFDAANGLLRNDGGADTGRSRASAIRSALQPIWSCVSSVTSGRGSTVSAGLRPVVEGLRGLQQERLQGGRNEAGRLAAPLLTSVPEAECFEQLLDLPAEQRLRVFDRLVDGLKAAEGERNSLRRQGLAVLAGYLATVAAGGAPSLALAEADARRWPDVTAWAYLIGGIAERIVWTSSFDGLGRFVARELMRPLRLDEAPTCDFALEEALVLADARLADPLVHLRIKQARIATVALLPGVNAAVPIADLAARGGGGLETSQPGGTQRMPSGEPTGAALTRLADELWPYLRPRIRSYLKYVQREGAARGGEQGGEGRRSGQPQLPLSDPKKE